jgi:hypothetical protein
VIQNMEYQMQTIRQRIKETQDQLKSYSDAHCVNRSYDVGDRVFLWVKPDKIWIKFGKGDKISPRFMEPFKILEKKGLLSYELALPDSLMRMQYVFHISILRHYICDPTHVIDMRSLQIYDEGWITNEKIHNLYHHIRKIWHRIVDQVKVQWENYSPHSTTWEDAYDMR